MVSCLTGCVHSSQHGIEMVSLTCAGVAALKSRQAIANAYDAMTLEAYLRSCGCSASYSIKCSDTGIDEYWTIS